MESQRMAEVEIKVDKTAWGGDLKPCKFADLTILEKLEVIAGLKAGDLFPEEFGPNNWGSVISHTCSEAKAEIERLRNVSGTR
jgi:hypothetical protein